jgi:HEAT repeat protein
VKNRLPIIIVAVAAVLIVAIGVRLRLNLSTPPPPTTTKAVDELASKGDYSARVAERLRLLRAEHHRREEPQGRDEAGNAAVGDHEQPPTPAVRGSAPEADFGRRRAALDLPVRNADVGHSVSELQHTLARDPNREKRVAAAQELGASEDQNALVALTEAMSDHDPEVRVAVVEALQDYMELLTPDMLAPVLKDKNANVRFEAVTLLGLMGGPEAQAAAGDLTEDPDPDVRDLAEEVQQVLASDPTPLPEVTPPHYFPPGRRRY